MILKIFETETIRDIHVVSCPSLKNARKEVHVCGPTAFSDKYYKGKEANKGEAN